MFILPPNCIVPSATSLTMRPVLPSFLYFISHTPCGRFGRHQIDTFESTWPGQNWDLTKWPVSVDSSRPLCVYFVEMACCRFRGRRVKLIPPSVRTQPG